ncbi:MULTISPECIES: hypothetical protein [Vibrio]|uniref:hypothetical protein n=1 Tax=Vibrio TaxID=662 RepID=UPI0005F0A43C|nr:MULTISPECIES: hypothetical protein [Vibrio]MCQ9076737.1 hypothetical protein [Vibrio harveyi]POC45746.1 hypothetical protein CRN48_11880 [Vibrio vulnificus]
MKIKRTAKELKKELKAISKLKTTARSIAFLTDKYMDLTAGMWTARLGIDDDKSYELWRARKGEHNNVKDLWYPPAEYITSLGRMNDLHDPVFYSCVGHNAKLGSLEEIRVEVGDIVTQLCCELPQQTPWFNFVGLGNSGEWFEKAAENTHYKDFFAQNKQEMEALINDQQELEKNILLDGWLNKLFVSPVRDNDDYSKTVGIAKAYLNGFQADGIFFPSVAADRRTVNLVLKPEIADNFAKPVSARVVEVVQRLEKGFYFRYIKESASISATGEIQWK